MKQDESDKLLGELIAYRHALTVALRTHPQKVELRQAIKNLANSDKLGSLNETWSDVVAQTYLATMDEIARTI